MRTEHTKARRAFKRLETDKEFRARLVASVGRMFYADGQALDDIVWEQCKLLRRIVEDES